MHILTKDLLYKNDLASLISVTIFFIMLLMVARSKNIIFWRPQVLKARRKGMSAKSICEKMNEINGDERNISREVFNRSLLSKQLLFFI